MSTSYNKFTFSTNEKACFGHAYAGNHRGDYRMDKVNNWTDNEKKKINSRSKRLPNFMFIASQ